MKLYEFFQPMLEANDTSERGPQTSAFKTPRQAPVDTDPGMNPTVAQPAMTQDTAKISETSFDPFLRETDLLLKERAMGAVDPEISAALTGFAEQIDSMLFAKVYSPSGPEEQKSIRDDINKLAQGSWSKLVTDLLESIPASTNPGM